MQRFRLVRRSLALLAAAALPAQIVAEESQQKAEPARSEAPATPEPKRFVTERVSGSDDSGPPATTVWRAIELTVSSPRCTICTAVSTGSMLRAAVAASLAAPAARVRSMVTVTVPGRRSAV